MNGMFIYWIGDKQEQYSLTIAIDGLCADYGLAISTVNGIPGTWLIFTDSRQTPVFAMQHGWWSGKTPRKDFLKLNAETVISLFLKLIFRSPVLFFQ